MKYIFLLIFAFMAFLTNAQCYKPYIKQVEVAYAEKRYHKAVANGEEALRCKDIPQKTKAQLLNNVKKAECLYVIPTPTAIETQDTTVFTIVEQMPIFPGGQTAMFKYLIENISFNTENTESGIEPRFYVNFIVEKDGTLSNIHVRGGGGENNEANEKVKRVISNMPKWNPGKQQGKFVRVQFTLPIRISLE